MRKDVGQKASCDQDSNNRRSENKGGQLRRMEGNRNGNGEAFSITLQSPKVIATVHLFREIPLVASEQSRAASYDLC